MTDPGVDPFAADAVARGGYQYSTDAPLSSRFANERLTQVSLELSDVGGKRVIDIGCGDGTYTVELEKRANPAELVGIDPAAAAIDVAKEHVGSKTDFSVGDAYMLPFEDGAFEFGFLRGVLHHVERPKEVLGEALRVAESVLVVEPNGYNPGLKLLEKVSPYHREHSERSYAPYRLDRWVEELGGIVVTRKWIGFVPMFCPDWYARGAKAIEPLLERTPVMRRAGCAQYVFVASRLAN